LLGVQSLPAFAATLHAAKAEITRSIVAIMLFDLGLTQFDNARARWNVRQGALVFAPEQRAFYYVRVLEIPTPRWTTYDAKIFGVDLPDDVPTSIQERAYTSPIWYTLRH
jgi:hypothetical protein